jgi:hypothetical protein
VNRNVIFPAGLNAGVVVPRVARSKVVPLEAVADLAARAEAVLERVAPVHRGSADRAVSKAVGRRDTARIGSDARLRRSLCPRLT